MKNKALKRLIYGLLAFLISFTLSSFKSNSYPKNINIADSGFRIKTIIVDAGHGVRRPNSPAGHYSMGASGTYSNERSVTLAIALKLQKAIEKNLNNVRAVLTRSTEDDVSFERRAEIANENKGDLFISLHCNALPPRQVREVVGHKHHKPIYKTITVPNHSGKGVLLLVYGFHRTKEEERAIEHNQIEEDADVDNGIDLNDPETIILINEYKKRFRAQSIHLSNLILDEFIETDGRKREGIREKGLYVLCHSAMPAVLVETGYIDNPEEEEYLNSEKGQNEIVDSIVRAIIKYKDEVEQVSK